ncbi:hypothetical protein KKC88_01395 [Patescibacteria group bacterium]|nr:hypothetical protein [Patescibacteria group bacterium]MBU1673353.1 hypothetical protein [Patescibacteria group bacterium]MBU1963987.1 hypothetical protein [Patescibacteria group bacterium]
MAEEKARDITDKDVEQWFKKKFEGWDKDGKCKKKSKKEVIYKGAGGGMYCIGWIGALVYYIQISTSFWDGILGVLKSFIWPAFLVHGLMKFIGL